MLESGWRNETGQVTAAANVAIARGSQALLQAQRPDGSWGCDTDMGPLGLSGLVIVETLFGVLSADDARLALQRFTALQLTDGSFEAFPAAGCGSVTVTAQVWAAALACEAVTTAASVSGRARAYVDAHGGLGAVTKAFRERSDPAALYLLAAGHVDATFLPRLPSGLGLMPLEQLLGRHVHAGNTMIMLVVAALLERHDPSSSGRGVASRAQAALGRRRTRQYLCGWQNDDGSWNGMPMQSCLMLLGLHAAGMTLESPEIKRAFAWLNGMKRRLPAGGLDVCATENDVWSTALGAMALHASGFDLDTAPLQSAQAFLLDAQSRVPMPRANQRQRHARRVGGWPFQRGNTSMPDTDDTGVVLAALAGLNGQRANRAVFRALDDGIAWLRDMQNPDGGFPTFAWGLPSKPPGPMFLRDLAISFALPALGSFLLLPPPELGDPSQEGVTGRVLWGLGAAGIKRDEPWICRAISFLIDQQCDNGAWWGRWKACYLAETATILLGLSAVGEDMSAAYVARAVRWLASCQNSDGGFGELPAAYRNPLLAGKGPSMPPVTAYAVLGLLASGQAPASVVARAAAYLVATQRADGLWDNAGWLHTFIPPDLLYTYDFPAQALPLLALSEVRRSAACG